ncbi:helix-turn-helix DNA binding protein [Arthrobacter phage Constance]|uniref:Helix-turn-helix DNA binding protein n=1 Tax=Arthrobacter phage Constance TaxID=2419950 RepID=A0A3G2KEQ7_9CAUD|nr:helix-turn-helix DNA binding protein [Arthrobacter phage Constance]AYN57459.1 helix-turn-helix DNA binding protein [Arthrobacter phage Constance]
MTARVPSGEFAATHDCGLNRTYRTEGLAAKAFKTHSCEHQRELIARAARVEERKTREGVKRDCQCKVANHVHGTPVAYVIDKCRCRACTDAATATNVEREKQKLFGRYDSGRVDAAPVREHMQFLIDNGMSAKQISKVSGIALSTVGQLIWGRKERGHKPYPRVMKSTAEKILAVKPQMELMAPGRYIDSTGARRRIQALVAIGWSQSRLAKQLGMDQGNMSIFMAGEQCTVKRALAVRDVYNRNWNQPQEGHDWRSRIAANRARNYAKARGWVPPLAWDDDTIDDPAAQPDLGIKQKLRDTIADDVEFLHGTGANREEIAERLGASTWDTVERQLHRIGRGDLVALVKTDTRDNARKASKGRAA